MIAVRNANVVLISGASIAWRARSNSKRQKRYCGAAARVHIYWREDNRSEQNQREAGGRRPQVRDGPVRQAGEVGGRVDARELRVVQGVEHVDPELELQTRIRVDYQHV